MYCQLLENAVRRLKKQPSATPLEVNVDLPWAAFLPREYVAGSAAADRGLSPAVAHSHGGAAGRFSPGAARSLWADTGDFGVVIASGGAAAAGSTLACGRRPPGETAGGDIGADGPGAELSDAEERCRNWRCEVRIGCGVVDDKAAFFRLKPSGGGAGGVVQDVAHAAGGAGGGVTGAASLLTVCTRPNCLTATRCRVS